MPRPTSSPRPALRAAVLFALAAAGVPGAARAEPPPRKVHPIAWAAAEHRGDVEILVVLNEQADLGFAPSIADRDERRWSTWLALLDTAERSQASLRADLDARGVAFQPFRVVNAIWLRGDRRLMRWLAQRPDVARVEANPRFRARPPVPAATAPGPQAVEWNVDRVGAPALWTMGHAGQGIVIGGQDTGVRWTHQAVQPHYRGWDGSVASHDFNWHDAIHSASATNPCGSDSPVPCDDGGHGTHTIATAGGGDSTGNEVGVAPAAQWIACRNMDDGWGTPATYLECFEFFLAPYPVGGDPTQGDPTMGPDVTVNSWACPPAEGCAWDVLQLAVEAQRAAGIMTVAAAGNSGPGCSTVDDPPALYDATYTVGATNGADALAGFSSRGPALGSGLVKPDIVAPGVGVRSATAAADDSYGAWSGTSMATPHVAGCVAVLWSAHPTYRNQVDRTEALLDATARRLTAIVEACGGDYVNGPNNSWGHGLIDLPRAVAEACLPPETRCDDSFDEDCDGAVDCADADCNGNAACPEQGRCADALDNDLDALLDCADPDCVGDAACPEQGNCTDALDNDQDGATDCADADCAGDAACPEQVHCTDGIDNDLDALVDCADVDCAGDAACPELGNCSDAVDNDLDGPIDCADVDCAGDAACPELGNCTDSVDNDLDAVADCADVDCAGDAACPELGNCSDSVDNDVDALVDCADPDCAGDPTCPEAGHCTDAVDNDLDALVDCADVDCAGDVACPEAGNCADSVDNDLDALVDCADADCVMDASCPEQGHCTDGVDNEADGLLDCADPDCAGDPACPERGNCTDGVDNDLDGASDCPDDDCAGDPACPEAAHCADGVDNDLDSFTDCADGECVPSVDCAGADWDGDGAPNAGDCAPQDSGAFAPGGEVAVLGVTRTPRRAALLSWADASAASGTATLYEIASERLSALHAMRQASGACVLMTQPSWTDARPTPGDGTFYLVRSVTTCGPAAGEQWGFDSLGSPRPGCP